MKREAANRNLDLVFNFSDLPINEDMNSLLNRGLGFVPNTLNVNKSETIADLNRHKRRVLWHYEFDPNNNFQKNA